LPARANAVAAKASAPFWPLSTWTHPAPRSLSAISRACHDGSAAGDGRGRVPPQRATEGGLNFDHFEQDRVNTPTAGFPPRQKTALLRELPLSGPQLRHAPPKIGAQRRFWTKLISAMVARNTDLAVWLRRARDRPSGGIERAKVYHQYTPLHAAGSTNVDAVVAQRRIFPARGAPPMGIGCTPSPELGAESTIGRGTDYPARA